MRKFVSFTTGDEYEELEDMFVLGKEEEGFNLEKILDYKNAELPGNHHRHPTRAIHRGIVIAYVLIKSYNWG